MKKLVLIISIIFASYSANAQFRAGVSGGIPIGDSGDFSNFALLVDASYLFDVSQVIQVGPTIGYSHSFLDSDFDLDDIQFIPIAAAGRFKISDGFKFGIDLGYAIGVNDGNDGGLYYSPRIQYSVSEVIDIVGAYRGVDIKGNTPFYELRWDMFTVGIEIGIN